MNIFCQHDYEIIDKTILPSAWEQITKTGDVKEIESIKAVFFVKKLFILMKCSKCDKLKSLVESNP